MEPRFISLEGERKYSTKSPVPPMAVLYRKYNYPFGFTQNHAHWILISLSMDATDKSSILKARDFIAEKEGRLHILVNKLVTIVTSPYTSVLICHAVLAKLAPSLDS